MARWRLTEPHYLNVPGTEWEYKETDQKTGKQARKVFPVPLLLNPEDPADHNYKAEGVIIVCYADRGMPSDIVFEGPPTPAMEPLDGEARAISAKHASAWVHPIESLQGQGFSQSILADLERQVDEVRKTQLSAATPGVTKAEFDDLKAQMAELMRINTALQTQLSDRPTRRI